MDKHTTLWTACVDLYFQQRLSIRSEKTRRQYHFAVADLGRCLGKTPTLGDLSDDNLYKLIRTLRDRGLAPKTVNERVGRLKSLWSWLARRGHISLFPTVERIPEPRRAPQAWSQAELERLFTAIDTEDLPVGAIPGPKWWKALHGVCWCTSERISAVLALEWDWLSENRLCVPAEVRKSQTCDMVYHLWPEVMDLLDAIRQPERTIIFEWPQNHSNIYKRYDRILKRAGLPHGRKSKFHRLRVSHATWVRALSGRAAPNLGHASESTTRKHYEDPRICRVETPKLFVPWEKSAG